MPLDFVLRFYRNHGLLQTHGHPAWRTIVGGSQSYVRAIADRLAGRIRRQCRVHAIRRPPGRVELRAGGVWESFDTVVIATHTDQALALLEDPDDHESSALGQIPYRINHAILHTDSTVLPQSRGAHASWNCDVGDCRTRGAPLRMTYDLSRLQRLVGATRYYVTLNDDGQIDVSRVIRRMTYSHPVYAPAGLEARRRLQSLNGRRHTVFCGAYLGHGFHEDGVRAGQDAARLVDDTRPGVSSTNGERS